MMLSKCFTGAVMALLLSSCSSPLDLVSSVIGSKPEVTAQAGASNIKQGVGLTSTVDASSRAEASIKDSSVGRVDSSSGKKVSASSISADIIRADTIQISNNDESGGYKWAIGGAVAVVLMVGGFVIGRRKAKEKAL